MLRRGLILPFFNPSQGEGWAGITLLVFTLLNTQPPPQASSGWGHGGEHFGISSLSYLFQKCLLLFLEATGPQIALSPLFQEVLQLKKLGEVEGWGMKRGGAGLRYSRSIHSTGIFREGVRTLNFSEPLFMHLQNGGGLRKDLYKVKS